jgi:CspA family cold shock protein
VGNGLVGQVSLGAVMAMEAQLLTGKVVRFDEVRGYGFVAPDSGGEDVFIHANELPERGEFISCGTKVEFKMVDGGRGPKAYDVRLLAAGVTPPAPAAPPAVVTPVAIAPTAAAAAAPVPDNLTEDLCEVLSEREFMGEITEVILAAGGQITASQILAIRDAVCRCARSHGWLDD